MKVSLELGCLPYAFGKQPFIPMNNRRRKWTLADDDDDNDRVNFIFVYNIFSYLFAYENVNFSNYSKFISFP